MLIESSAILDHLDEMAEPSVALIARQGPQRRAALKVCALATGLCDKMVSLVYEHVLHEATSQTWIDRCEVQVGAVLDVLEASRAQKPTRFWFGDRIGHADVAVACAMRFLSEAHPAIHALDRWPKLSDESSACEGLKAFQAVVQRFDPPARRP